MKNFLNKLYLYKFIDSFTLIFPIFTLLFQKAGMSVTQIALLILIWSITGIILEVPTGVLADRYSRRNLLVIANVSRAICFLFWLGGNFWFFAIGFVFWSIKNSLAGGTFEALVYDELKVYGKEQTYEKVSGKVEGWRFLGVATSALAGGFVAQYSFTLALVLSVISSLIAAFTILSVRSVRKVEDVEEKNNLHIMKDAVVHISKNVPLMLTILLICAIFGTYGATDEYWALIYQKFGFSVGIIGVLVAINYGLVSFAGYTTHFFDKVKLKNISYLFIILASIVFIVVGIGKNVFLIPLVFIALYLYQVANIKAEARLQHQIASSQRATIFSVKSFIFELVYMLFVFLFGIISDRLGVLSILVFSGGFTLLALFAFTIIEQTLKNKTSYE